MNSNPDIASASHAATNDLAFKLIESALTPTARLLDLGCGPGHMTRRIARWFSSRGLDPRHSIVAADISAAGFQATEAPFVEADFSKPLPFDDASFDLIVCVEVIEHLTRPYDFLAEVRRVLKSDGVFVVSTPNIFNLQSRLRYLLTGMYGLYELPTVDRLQAGRLCGHIMPLSLVYLHYGLRRAGFTSARLHLDRAKRSSYFLSWLLLPFLWLGRKWQIGHSRKYDRSVYEENLELVRLMNSRAALISRSILLEATGRMGSGA